MNIFLKLPINRSSIFLYGNVNMALQGMKAFSCCKNRKERDLCGKEIKYKGYWQL